jgi:hypothetical protein
MKEPHKAAKKAGSNASRPLLFVVTGTGLPRTMIRAMNESEARRVYRIQFRLSEERPDDQIHVVEILELSNGNN